MTVLCDSCLVLDRKKLKLEFDQEKFWIVREIKSVVRKKTEVI